MDAMTLHHRNINRLAEARRKNNRASTKLAKALKEGRVQRNIYKLMYPDRTAEQADAFYRWRDLRKVLPFDLRDMSDMRTHLNHASPSEKARIDNAMIMKGWEIDQYGLEETRYIWPVAWGGAEPGVVVI